MATIWTSTATNDIPWVPNSNRSIRSFSIVLKDTTSRTAPFSVPPASWGPTLCWAGLPASWATPIPILYTVPIAARPATYAPAQWPSYPQAPWAPYPPYYPYQQNGNEEDSETARPDKFTGRDPSKLRPFIICCVMDFDSRPRKFATDCQ